LEQIRRAGIMFEFSLREAGEDERGGTVVWQYPSAGAIVSSDTVTDIIVTVPTDLRENEVFGLFTYNLPPNPFPLPVRLDAQPPMGERVRIFGTEFPGGKFTIPYRLPAGSILIFTMMDRELYREAVRETARGFR